MGNRSSRYVKKYEHGLHIERIESLLTDLQKEIKEHKSETAQHTKRLNKDLKSVHDASEHQKKWFLGNECELQILKTNVSRLQELDEVKTNIRKVVNEHLDDRMKLSGKIKELVSQERESWENNVFELRERYETMRKYSMELISMDLSHEREIKDLRYRIQVLEDKSTSTGNENDVSQNPSKISPKSSSRIYSERALKESDSKYPASSYELKFSKINMAMKKLKEDIKMAEIKKVS